MKYKELVEYIKSDWMRINNDDIQFKAYKILNFRLLPVVLIRLSYYFYLNNFKFVSRFIQLINFIIYGIEVPPYIKIGKGLLIPHTNGIVIGAKVIGENVTIFHQVTIGAKNVDLQNILDERPTINSNVFIGSGAKIYGKIIIGNNSEIYSNSVITKNIPPNSRVAGHNKLLNDQA